MTVKVYWFGEIIEMEVIGYDIVTDQYRLKHINAYGSFYTNEVISHPLI